MGKIKNIEFKETTHFSTYTKSFDDKYQAVWWKLKVFIFLYISIHCIEMNI